MTVLATTHASRNKRFLGHAIAFLGRRDFVGKAAKEPSSRGLLGYSSDWAWMAT